MIPAPGHSTTPRIVVDSVCDLKPRKDLKTKKYRCNVDDDMS